MDGGGRNVCIVCTDPGTHELHRAGCGSWCFHCDHVPGPSSCTAQFQRYFGRRRCGGVHRQRIRCMGTDLSSAGNASGLSWPEVIPGDWRRVAHARSLGFASPFCGTPDLALHADFFPWLHGIRHGHRGLVPGWRTFHHSYTRSGRRKWAAGSYPRPFSFAYQDREPPVICPSDWITRSSQKMRMAWK